MSQEVDERSVLRVQTPTNTRRIQKVPFVEIYNGRVAGVVSSGSDADRVYVSFIEAGTLNFYCSTNNNRPCGGLRGGPCKHIDSLITEAVIQYGPERVLRGLKIEADPSTIRRGSDVMRHISGSQVKEEASIVFSRFLSYLSHLENPGSDEPMPEMTWFIAG